MTANTSASAARGLAIRTRRRDWLRWAVAAAILGTVLLASLLSGELALTPAEVWQAITGQADDFTTTVVLGWRLPRALAAVAFGAALGAAGAIFQALTRNPLGSPDVIGFSTGAYTGVLLILLAAPAAGFAPLAAASLLGGIATAGLVVVLSARHGLGGRGFILTGIAVSAFLAAVNTWLMLRTDTATATAGANWSAGTLDNTRWEHLAPALLTLIALAGPVAVSSRRLRILVLGDDLAAGLGLHVARSRALLIVGAVSLTALTTAAAGPILFIALGAPHLARASLPRSHPVLSAALAGAVLLAAADWIAAHAFAPVQLPVGAITVSLGGAYLTLTMLRRGR